MNAKCDSKQPITREWQRRRLCRQCIQHTVKILKGNVAWIKAIAAKVRFNISASQEPNSIIVYVKLEQQIILIHAVSIVE